MSRTQEFVLRWSSDGGRKFQEIVRQQWNFSPPTTNREIEEYRTELSDVSALELVIVPDISGGSARASLRSFDSVNSPITFSRVNSYQVPNRE